MTWLTDYAWLAWLGIALALAAVEAATVDFVFLMLAGGALAAAVVAALGGGFYVQVVVGVVAALLLLFTVRPMLRRHFTDGELARDIGAAGLVGRHARVVQRVSATDGRVKLNGETWTARTATGAQACPPGAEVRVLAIEGATAIVVALTTHDHSEDAATQ
jgi:membrane protein implicated in regulation of membrane protease activity